jgi:hypothetical protein
MQGRLSLKILPASLLTDAAIRYEINRLRLSCGNLSVAKNTHCAVFRTQIYKALQESRSSFFFENRRRRAVILARL